MNKWYQSAPCKGILVVLEHILAVTMICCLVWTLSYPGGNVTGILFEKPQKEYSQSKGFEQQMLNAASEIVAAVPKESDFTTEGKYDGNKIVDIKDYYENTRISGENKNGLAYKLEDLANWYGDETVYYADGTAMRNGDEDESIVVCQKEDGTYHYYYESEFRKEVKDGNIRFGNLSTEKDTYSLEDDDEAVSALIDGWIESSSPVFWNLLNKENQQIYTKCWVYDGIKVSENHAPVGAKNILEIVNNDKRWNGKLSDAMEGLDIAVGLISTDLSNWETVKENYQEGNTNLTYLLVDLKTDKVYTNKVGYQKFDSWEKNLESLKKKSAYTVMSPKLAEYKSNMNTSADSWKAIVGSNMWTDDYICAFAVDTTYSIPDQFYQENTVYQKYAPTVRGIFWLAIASGAAMLAVIVWLTIVAGRSNKKEGICLNLIDHIKTEVFIGIFGILPVVGILIIGSRITGSVLGVAYENYTTTSEYAASAYAVSSPSATITVPTLIIFGIYAVCICAVGLTFWLSMVRRVKAGTLWKNSLLKLLNKYFHIGIKHLNEIWKAVILFSGFILIHWIVIAMWDPGFLLIIMLVAEAGAFFYLMRRAIGRARIIRGVKAIADGQIDYKIPTDGLKGGQLEAAVSINQIGSGFDRAVEESLKNERLKTDLITNVSHDIKTPLTSIINYVELLKREKFDDPKIQNYIQVLEEKAYRLKTLTEDVVEASKVSSGNINLEMMNLNLVELVNQTCAEFEEKYEARHLELVLNLPAEPVTIYADGRRMWRVLANIFNNAAKYAMEGSRVYVDLFQTDKEVQFTMKNVSEQRLNISANELTERFIRGDLSRSTEGSGLGLSIAQNLTKLQGGTFELYLDGDLFKVLIRFPVHKEEKDVYQEVEL